MTPHPTHPIDWAALTAQVWSALFSVTLLMLVYAVLSVAMQRPPSEWQDAWQTDPGTGGLNALLVVLCLNALGQVLLGCRSVPAVRWMVWAWSVARGVAFFGHHVWHLLHGEPVGWATLLDLTHHLLSAVAAWSGWRWARGVA